MTKKALKETGVRTAAHVTQRKMCWWLKVNTKPVRTCMADGAKFPYTIRYKYEANGVTYTGWKFLWIDKRVPDIDETFPVYYDAANPKKHYADF